MKLASFGFFVSPKRLSSPQGGGVGPNLHALKPKALAIIVIVSLSSPGLSVIILAQVLNCSNVPGPLHLPPSSSPVRPEEMSSHEYP